MTEPARLRPNAESSESTLATGVSPEHLAGLRRWNLGLSMLHAAQTVLAWQIYGGSLAK